MGIPEGYDPQEVYYRKLRKKIRTWVKVFEAEVPTEVTEIRIYNNGAHTELLVDIFTGERGGRESE